MTGDKKREKERLDVVDLCVRLPVVRCRAAGRPFQLRRYCTEGARATIRLCIFTIRASSLSNCNATAGMALASS